MNIIVRTDASSNIGLGHLYRCLTLAEKLQESENRVSFICRELPGNQNDFIEKKGFSVYRLPCYADLVNHTGQNIWHQEWRCADWEDDAKETVTVLKEEQEIDWIISDHYGIDERWELKVRPYTKRIMVIDDLANRPHNCDLLLDQNLYDDMNTRYDALVPHQCRKLIGPQYTLLRSEFIEVRKNLRKRDGEVRRILIFFGGSDPTNDTEKALEAIRLIHLNTITIDVIVGNSNVYKEKIEQICSDMQDVSYHCDVDNMAEFMAGADLSIGSGGTSTWERCFLGLPTIAMIIADNQYEMMNAVVAAGAAWNLGWSYDVTASRIADAVHDALRSPHKLKKMSDKAIVLVGGKSFRGVEAVTQLMRDL